YFRQSEQIDTGISVAVEQTDAGWRGGGIAIQRLPDQNPLPVGSEQEDDWRRAMVLMGSAQRWELADPTLEPNTVLYRLFHEDGVRVFDPSALTFECRCSEEKVGRALASLPPDDLADLADDGIARVTCEFCNTTREFPLGDVASYRSDARS
ncbi:MAG: Hsp33 family molecular chaperone HslO, partial [Pseudomonadota bacterium]